MDGTPKHLASVGLTLVFLLAFVLRPASTPPARVQTVEGEEREPGQSRIELLQQVGGASRVMAAHGDNLYVAVGPRLVVLDASNQENPIQVGQSPVLPGI